MRVQDAGGGTLSGGFVLMLAGRLHHAALRSCSRGSAPSAALGRLEDGAPAPHEHLRRGWLATLPRREWRGLDKNGFALTLAGECPLFSAPN